MTLDRDEDTLFDGVETGTGIFIDATSTGTNPAASDTDGDTYDVGVEVAAGSDPDDSMSTPQTTPVPVLSRPMGWILAALLTGAGALVVGRPLVASGIRP